MFVSNSWRSRIGVPVIVISSQCSVLGHMSISNTNYKLHKQVYLGLYRHLYVDFNYTKHELKNRKFEKISFQEEELHVLLFVEYFQIFYKMF